MATPKPGPESSSNTVAGVKIALQDAAMEVHYPTPRALWPQAAHAPSVLTFRTGATSFKSLRKAPHTDRDQQNLRTEFTSLAIALTSLGKAPQIEQNGKPLVDKDRSVAYLDAISMGERASLRRDFLGDSNNASSCGMFVRNLYKLIGVKIPSYSSEYQSGTVMAAEQNFAIDNHAMVFPGKTWDPVLDGNGDPVLDTNGKPITKPAVPKLGDAIYWNKGTSHRHVQVVIGVMDPQGSPVRRAGKDGKTRQYETVYYHVIQGGAGATKDRFPNDGSCMAIKQGYVHFKTDEWTANIGGNILPISYGWIDIYKLAEFCDNDPMIIPVRQNIW